MSKRLDVLKALKAIATLAAPLAHVVGLDGDEEQSDRVPPGGRIVVRSGDPGEPEIDLSPLAYNWTHRIPIEFVNVAVAGMTAEEALDATLVQFGNAIAADRHLGGLCDWVAIVAPGTEDVFVDGARPPRGADLIVIATYVTDSELS